MPRMSCYTLSVDDPPLRRKAGGITLDWSTVPPATQARTLPDGRSVAIGEHYLPCGTVLLKIEATGLYGPADASALDGRQTFTSARRGEAFLLNRTVIETDPVSAHPAVFDGGRVHRERLVMNGANQPTQADVLAMFPDVTFG